MLLPVEIEQNKYRDKTQTNQYAVGENQGDLSAFHELPFTSRDALSLAVILLLPLVQAIREIM